MEICGFTDTSELDLERTAHEQQELTLSRQATCCVFAVEMSSTSSPPTKILKTKLKRKVRSERHRRLSRPKSRGKTSITTALYERVLYRVGSWSKRLALVGYVHRFLGDVSDRRAVVLFALGTFASVYRTIYDTIEPHGSRRYIANLAGDDAAVTTIRNNKDPVPWERTPVVFRKECSSWFVKAVRCGVHNVVRNRKTLFVFWVRTWIVRGSSFARPPTDVDVSLAQAYSLLFRLVGFIRGRGQGRIRVSNLIRSLFPNGVAAYLKGCARTSSLLFTFGFVFWSLVGLGKATNFPSQGLGKTQAVGYVSVAAVVALPMETRRRWKALAAFMLMSVVD